MNQTLYLNYHKRLVMKITFLSKFINELWYYANITVTDKAVDKTEKKSLQQWLTKQTEKKML